MTEPDLAALLAASEATWPPVRVIDLPGWRLRDGGGGGQRVSAATATGPAPSIRAMIAAQEKLGQAPLVMIRPGEDALDRALRAEGFRVKDPVTIYLAPARALATPPPPVSTFEVAWPPVRVQEEIWAGAGIGPARLAVMARAEGPKCTLLGRSADHPTGTAFLALAGKIAVLHALEVAPGYRRQRTGANLMNAAAIWAGARGANWLAVLVTRENGPANALYSSLGMRPVGGYHYRVT